MRLCTLGAVSVLLLAIPQKVTGHHCYSYADCSECVAASNCVFCGASSSCILSSDKCVGDRLTQVCRQTKC